MWGTTSFCDELTDDFGGPFEGTSIDNCRLFGRLAEIQSHGVLGLLQHYPPINGHRQPGGACPKSANTGLSRCDHLTDFAPYGKYTADQAI